MFLNSFNVFMLSIQFFVSLESTDAAQGSIKRSSLNFNLDNNASYFSYQVQGPQGIKRWIHNETETQNKHLHKWHFSSQKSSSNDTKIERNKTRSFFDRFPNFKKQSNEAESAKDILDCSKCYSCQPRITDKKPPLNNICSSTERSDTAPRPIYLHLNIYVRNISTDSKRFKEVKPINFDNLEKFYLIPVKDEYKKQNDFVSQQPLNEYYAFVRNNGENSQNVGPEYQRYSLDSFQGKLTSKNTEIPPELRYPEIPTIGMNVGKQNFEMEQSQFIPPYFNVNYFNGRRKNEDISKARINTNEWLSQPNTNTKNNIETKQIFAFQPNTENKFQRHLLSSFYFGNNLPKYNKHYYKDVDINKNY